MKLLLHPHGGEHREVADHIAAVVADPLSFGLGARFVRRRQGEDADARRARVLAAVLRRGWILASYRGADASFVYWRLTRQTARAIFDFLAMQVHARPCSQVTLSEAATQRILTVAVDAFRPDIEAHRAGTATRGAGQLHLLGRAFGHGHGRNT